MLAEKQLGLLRDILDSAKFIRAYMDGVSHDQFMALHEKQDAVMRRLEIVGEAASRLAPETRELFPHLPFRSMRGMRNILVHDYGDVDLEQVWTTVQRDINGLIEALEIFFASGESE